MSGVVAILTRDPARSSIGGAGLARLDHVVGYVRDAAELGSIWAGVCGDPERVSVAASGQPDGRDGLAREPGAALCAFSGDLLNRARLRRELGLDAAVSPATVALAAYRRWGRGLFDRLEGAFALVVHDAVSGLTLAGVDPCCILPLYLTVAGGDVLIASEAKAFLEHPDFRPRLDRQAVGELACFGQPLAGKPLFAGVRGLPHGAHFEVDARGDVKVTRHWDVRRLPPPSLHGAAYLDRLEEVFRELAAEAYDDQGVLLPLTGGLDSRLFAAAAPRDRGVSTLTFGAPEDHDCALAARVAAARGLPHSVSPLDPAYAATYGAEAVWLLEGRLSPVGNITGSLMDRLRPATAYISGAGAAAGRHFWRSKMLVPDWAWDHAAADEFERLFTAKVMQFGLPMSSIPDLLVDGSELRAAAEGERGRILASTRGRHAVDRQDLYVVQEGERFGQTGLMIADLWVQTRAPLLTRRWVEAMLSGVPSERIDDLARVRLVMRMDARVAAVPWSLTHLPLPASAQALRALRVAGRVTRRRLEPESAGDGPAHAGRGASVLHAVQHRLYRHGDRRDDWLRGPSRSLVEDVLLSPRLADHGVFRPDAVRELVADHMAGGSLGSQLGLLLQVELWQRLFEDGAPPPVVRRS